MKNNIRIFASYSLYSDCYVATISTDTTDTVLTEQNGSELVESVKAATGIEIEYNYNARTFQVPSQYQF